MPVWIQRVVGLFFTRKKVLGYIAAAALTAIYLIFGVTPEEVKEAVKSATPIELPAELNPQGTPSGSGK